MNSRIGQSRSTLVSDFETTTDKDDCRVWAWGVCNVWDASLVELGNSIESFIRRCTNENATIYFHNLAFDGMFILDYIMKHGFVHVDRNPKNGEFSTLISDKGKFYSITVRWDNGILTEFRDSLKKLPMSVSNIATSFNLDEIKGSIDYDKYRPVGHKLTDAEKDYIINDVTIVAKALRVQLEEGMLKLTVGSDSLKQFKDGIGKKQFSRLFPQLPLPMDAEIRLAYRGGFTYADERTRGRIVGPGKAYDVNSLYPSVMYDSVLPYDHPRFTRGKPEITEAYPLFITSITFTAELKPGHIPCIQVKGSPYFVGTEYQRSIPEPVTMFCTNVDLDLWCEHYDMDILSYNGAWQFKGLQGIFNDYIDYWSNIKKTETGGLRTIAKLHLNSLYGKFATNPNVTGKIPYLQNGVVHLALGPEDQRAPVYTAMGVFITAYARDRTIRAAQANYGSFLYADTDSLHLQTLDAPAGLTVDNHELGAWKHEYTFKRALFARAKAYTVQFEDEALLTHIAGLPDTVAEDVGFADYFNGKVFSGKLQPKRVSGGVVLEDVGFTLNKLINQ